MPATRFCESSVSTAPPESEAGAFALMWMGIPRVSGPTPYSAVRLSNGNTLTCSMNASLIAEVDRSGKPVWKETLQGRPFAAGPIAEPEICCGAAGSYNLTEPEMSDRLAHRKLQNILAVNPQAVITGNVGCSMQIQAALRQAGHDVWVAHPMELLDLSYRGLAPPRR